MAFPNGKKSYTELNEAERLTWHTGVYAFRHVQLDLPIAPGSPPDAEGKYFRRDLVEKEVARLREKRRPPPIFDTAAREGRAILYAYARNHGYATWDEAEAAGVTYTDVVRSMAGIKPMPGSRQDTEYQIGQLQKDLGIDAKPQKPEFNPTPEQMVAGRAALGFPEPAPQQAEPEPHPQQESSANGD
jgi:hypothetical protein